jgi:integrase/recombinase XerD
VIGRDEMTKAYLDIEDVAKLEKAAQYLRDKLLIRLLFHLGCRVSEALGVTVDDIDFGESTVTIKHLKERVRLSCPRCGGRLARAHRFCSVCGFDVDQALSQVREQRRFRSLPVDNDTLAMLREYIDRKGPRTKGERAVLFGINRHRAWQIVRKCAERAGLPRLKNSESGKVHGVSPHRLRDAFAINAVKINDSGDGIRMLQEHLGHQSISTTMRYRKVSGEEQRTWYQKLWPENKTKGERDD